MTKGVGVLLAIAAASTVAVATLAVEHEPAAGTGSERSAGRLVAPPELPAYGPRYPSRNTDGREGAGGRAVAYRHGARRVDDADVVAAAPEARLWRTGFGSWEPTLGVDSTGSILFSARNANTEPGVARSDDGGKTWQPVKPPTHATSLDPYVWVDPVTDRVFASDIDPTIFCHPMSYSDDRGETWEATRACGIGDHQSLFGGPPPAGGAKPRGYPNVLYYCAVGKGATTIAPTEADCLRSLDGGKSWELTGEPAFPPHVTTAGRCAGFHGHGTVGADGTAYLPAGWCGKPHLAISRDEGATWDQIKVSDLPARGHEAGVVADPDGNLHYSWVSTNDRAYLATSRDGGATWSSPIDITPPGVTEVDAFAASLDLRDSGRLAAVFMGTEDAKPSPTTAWNAYVVTTTDSLADDPLFYATRINDPAGNALWRGASCCGNIGDFIDVAIGPDGSAWAALVDSCPGNDECIRDTTIVTPRGEGVVGQVAGGPSLVAEPR